MKKFLISDTHFFHGNIIKYENRPFKDIESMNEEIIKRWNSVVTNNDVVYHLGDVSFSGADNTRRIISRLNGKKFLVMGNHDKCRPPKWWRDIGFDEASRWPIILDDFYVLQHEPPQYLNPAMPYFYFYGHVHSSEMYRTITKQTACMCVERWDYKPILIEDVINLSKLAT